MSNWFHGELTIGSSGPDVDLVRRKLNAPNMGPFDASLAARVRGFQRTSGLPVTGVVDEATANALGAPARKGMVPTWYRRPLGIGCHGNDVESLNVMLGLEPSTAFGVETDAAVRRLQSQLWMIPTGLVDETVACEIGDDVPVLPWKTQ